MEAFLEIHFEGQLSIYLTKKIEKKQYDIMLSDEIQDQFWNLAYVKTNTLENWKEVWQEVKRIMMENNREPILYLPSFVKMKEEEKRKLKENLTILYTDVWMVREELTTFPKYKSEIDFDFFRVEKEQQEDFIKAVFEGFSGNNPEDPYEALTEGYRIQLEKSFEEKQSKYSIRHYLGKKKEEWICTATVLIKGEKAIVYNVTTNRKYQRMGVCKEMMTRMIQDLEKCGVTSICLQTEKGFYTKQVYEKMGFKEIFEGVAYGK